LVASLGSARAAEPATARAIASVARTAFVADHLKALLVRVDVDGKPIYAEAFGESMSGVPATTSMHFRNGAMAFAYMATTIVELADRGKLKLSDHLSKYFPQLPHATKITLRNLANMTSGYADYVYQPEVLEGTVLDPFRQYTPDELIHIGTSKPMAFAPGTNWGYSHTNYIILGRVIEKVTGLPLATALQRYIMTPMHLTQTKSIATPEIPEPVLHTFSSERREELGVKASAPFYEEATYWNPSWTTIEGAVQVTDLADWTRSMELIGSGALISKASFASAVEPQLIGFGHPQTGCAACRKLTAGFNYGLGVVLVGPWTVQNKSFAGTDASVGYLRSRRIAISVAATYLPAAFDAHGNAAFATQKIFAQLAGVMAPGTLPALLH
jgi:CubicO group peptidase (beta-lactamase class C family)